MLWKILEKEFEGGGNSFHISMTFGVTAAHPEESFDETIRRADDLLYEGKQNGRNRIISAK